MTRRGLAALIERQLSNDLGWLERDLRAVKNLGPLIATLAPAEELQAQAFQEIRAWVCGRTVAPLTAADLLVCRSNVQETVYRFAPARAEDALLIARLGELDTQSSPLLLRAVSAHAIERIRAEARKTFGDR